MDFTRINEDEFEKLCRQLLFLIYPQLKAVDGRGGDMGTDSFLGTINNQETVFQFKHFPERLASDHWTKIKDSLKTSYEKNTPLKWHLLISSEFTIYDWSRWENLKKSYPNVELDVWLGSNLISLISQHKEKFVTEFPKLYPDVEVAKSLLRLAQEKKSSIQGYKPARFRGEKRVFVGRKEEIDEIAKCYTESNDPVSIIGEGGIGKSALAFEAIHQIEAKFDLVVDIYLSSGPDFATFLSDIARRLGIVSNEYTKLEINDRSDHLKNFFARFSRPLLYLDNYETVADALLVRGNNNDAKKISSFLHGIPQNTSIILTSRNRHNIDSERIISLTGLSLEESRDLFLLLTKSYFRNAPHESIIQAIDEVCTKTHGHALSIELLARSYRGGQSSEIRDMANRIVIDLENPRTEEGRLKSIRSCFNYSFNRLSQEHRKILRRLVIFRSPFLERAAKSIVDSSREIILDLYDRSLLQQINSDQHGDLEEQYYLYYFHPVIRGYLEEVNKRGHATIKDSHKGKFWRFYSELIKKTHHSRFQDSDPELIRVFQIALRDLENDYLRVLDLIPDPALTSQISNHLGMLLAEEGMFELSLQCHNKCLKIDKEMQDLERMATDYDHIGNISLAKGNHDDALLYQFEGLRLFKMLDEATNNTSMRFILGVAGSLGNIGSTFTAKGNLGEALKYQLEALQKHRNLDISVGHTTKLLRSAIARDLGSIGNIFTLKSDLDNNVLIKSTALDIAYDNHYQAYKIHLETDNFRVEATPFMT